MYVRKVKDKDDLVVIVTAPTHAKVIVGAPETAFCDANLQNEYLDPQQNAMHILLRIKIYSHGGYDSWPNFCVVWDSTSGKGGGGGWRGGKMGRPICIH